MDWLDRAFQLDALADYRDRPVAQNLIIMCALQSVLGLATTMIDLFGRGEFVLQHLIGCFVISILTILPFLLILTRRVRLVAWIFCVTVSLGVFAICLKSAGINSSVAPMLSSRFSGLG